MSGGDCQDWCFCQPGYVMTDSTIRTAVAAWLSDPTTAEATYGHISTWETGGVTDMSMLFCVRRDWMEGRAEWDTCVFSTSSFNEDIGAWDTSGVTAMHYMFYYASVFDQDLSGWRVDKVTSMRNMFLYASAFDQDFGWCVDDDVDLTYAFDNTPCASTSCGVLHTAALSCGGTPMGDGSIRTAVAAWFTDATAAEATYGHISTWDTSGVTDMSGLFDSASSFNDDISPWDTSGVTTMNGMFRRTSSFNQPIGAWDTSGVRRMDWMFVGSAFNQPIGD